MSNEQTQAALLAVQGLIAQARFQAYELEADGLADLLDGVELLPVLIAEDRLAEFDDMMQGIVEKHPECRYIFEQFAEQHQAVG